MTLRRAILAAALAAAVAACSGPRDRPVHFAQSDSLGANYVVTQIGVEGLKAMGYDVTLSTVNTTMFFLAAAQGDLDMAMDINFPQQEPGFRKVADRAVAIPSEQIGGGGVNGYMIDKKTADAYHITSLAQMRDPKIAGLFGRDGKADLINCDASWSCGQVVDYQLDAFGLRPTVNSVRGKYEALMIDAVARIRRGEPAFFYAWSPSWMNKLLAPGKDVVWLPTPFDALPGSVPNKGSALVHGLQGCAGGADPCRMAMASWNYETVANRAFVAKHPDVKVLFNQLTFPSVQWSAWEQDISQNGGSDREIRKLADAWIQEHRPEFEAWLTKAKRAGPRPVTGH